MPAHEKHYDEQFAESDIDENLNEGKVEAAPGIPGEPQVLFQNSVMGSPSGQTLPLRPTTSAYVASPYQTVVGLPAPQSAPANMPIQRDLHQFDPIGGSKKYVAYTIKLPSDQLAALQTIWLELKRLYGTHSPDKSGMIQQAITDWLRRWDGPERAQLLQDLLEIRQDTRRRQYRK